MFKRQTSGSVVCRSCGRLVGVNDAACYSCGARNPALWGFAPVLRRMGEDLGFTKLTIGACVLLYAASLLLDPAGIRMNGFLSFLSPSSAAVGALGVSGAIPVYQYGRWWTVLSAGWLHGSILHIFFNMYWVRTLAPPTARLYGPGRMVIIYTIASIFGFALSSSAFLILYFLGGVFPLGAQGLGKLMGVGGYTLGASAALMGLLGAMIHYGRRGGSSEVARWAWGYAVLFFVFGLVVRGTDNWAHLGGFLGGYLASRVLDPLKPERMNHLLAALGLLLASAAAVVASLVTAL